VFNSVFADSVLCGALTFGPNKHEVVAENGPNIPL